MSYVIRNKNLKRSLLAVEIHLQLKLDIWSFYKKNIKKRESNKSAIYINLKPQHILLIFIPHTEINPSIALNWKSVPSHDNVPIIIFFLLLLRIEWVSEDCVRIRCMHIWNKWMCLFFCSSSCCFKSISLNINTLFYKPHIPPHYITYLWVFVWRMDWHCL